MTRFLPLIVFAFFACLAGPVFAAQGVQNAVAPARFFSSMQDVPIVAGLAELADQTVTFDKPEGRIIESVAEIESGSFDSVKNAYDEALPQLGWSRIAENSYVRDDEFLHLNFETYNGRNFVRVLVRPQGGNAD